MAVPTFVQKSRINQIIYQIRDDWLQVSARGLVGRFTDYGFELRRIDPNYEPRITRNYLLLIIPLIILALCLVAIWGLMHQSSLPEGSPVLFYQWPVTWGVLSLFAAIRGSRRIEYYQFKNRAGRPILSIIREREQAKECAAFITTLIAHIEIAQADVTPEERTKMFRSLGSESFVGLDAEPGLDLWKVSIALGVLASGLPLVPRLDYYLPLFLIVFPLCVGAAALCVFSFTTKESKRWWSVIGLVLSLVPPLFY